MTYIFSLSIVAKFWLSLEFFKNQSFIEIYDEIIIPHVDNIPEMVLFLPQKEADKAWTASPKIPDLSRKPALASQSGAARCWQPG